MLGDVLGKTLRRILGVAVQQMKVTGSTPPRYRYSFYTLLRTARSTTPSDLLVSMLKDTRPSELAPMV